MRDRGQPGHPRSLPVPVPEFQCPIPSGCHLQRLLVARVTLVPPHPCPASLPPHSGSSSSRQHRNPGFQTRRGRTPGATTATPKSARGTKPAAILAGSHHPGFPVPAQSSPVPVPPPPSSVHPGGSGQSTVPLSPREGAGGRTGRAGRSPAPPLPRVRLRGLHSGSTGSGCGLGAARWPQGLISTTGCRFQSQYSPILVWWWWRT